MNPQCTWFIPPDHRCPADGIHDHKDNLGVVWASLCQQHHEQLEMDCNHESSDPARMLRSWILASGGAKKMAERMG